MKWLLIFVLFIGVEAHGQSLADRARAERLRQQSVEAVFKVNVRGEKQLAPAKETPKEQAVETKPDPKKELRPEEKLMDERVDIIKTRADLLVRMGQVRDDPAAVRAIELELMELAKRSEAAKLQHLGKPQTATPQDPASSTNSGTSVAPTSH